MIPLRVSLKNFLCYAEEVFDFESEQVWLLHGPNGVGKSAVFDAMLYALFGEHERREKSGAKAGSVLRHGASSMRVEFDFEYASRRYRVWRTRTKSGQPGAGAGELNGSQCEPIRNVNNAKELTKWVEDTLGFNQDTFVSAILLRQGAAERLIDKDAADRDRIFDGIIDLKPFRDLHDDVIDDRRKKNAEAEVLESHFKGVTEVLPEEVRSAEASCEAAAGEHRARQAEAEIFRGLEEQARNWESLGAELAALNRKLDGARDRLTRVNDIERDAARLRTLHEVIPLLANRKTAIERLKIAEDQFQRAEVVHRELQESQKTLRDALTIEQGIHDAQREIARTLALRIANDKPLAEQLEREIAQAEKLANLRKDLEADEENLKALKTNLDDLRIQAESELAESQEAKDAIGFLKVLHAQRMAVRDALRQQAIAATSKTALEAKQRQAVIAETEARTAFEASSTALTTGQQEWAEFNGSVNRLKDQLASFDDVVKQPHCSLCLQPITPEHVQRERDHLMAKIEAESRSLAASARNVKMLKATDDDALTVHTNSRTALQQLKLEIEAADREHDQAGKSLVAGRKAFATALAELDAKWQARVAPVEVDGFPSAGDLDATSALAGLLAASRTEAADLQTQVHERNRLQDAIATRRQAIEGITAPADLALAREELLALQASLKNLEDEQKVAEAQSTKSAKEVLAKSGELKKVDTATADSMAQLNDTATKLAVARRECEIADAAVPEAMRDTIDINPLVAERDELARANVESDFIALEEDRKQKQHWDDELARLNAKLATIAPEARKPSREVKALLEAALTAVEDALHRHQECLKTLAALDQRKTRRAEYEEKWQAAANQKRLLNRLAGYLGVEGIQRELTTKARAHIIEYANAILETLSRGQLRFARSVPEDDGQFSFNFAGCPAPIVVGNLSGGQRCRVAVSLALAVCQYASGQARPLESVIIDEAFSPLDREGRRAMIEALKESTAPRGLLKRIIVVSHHDDVLASFDNRYLLQSEGGITKKSRT